MTALFPDSSRLTGGEGDTFTSFFMPIIGQMETLDIAALHRPSIFFSLLPPNTSACNACAKMQLKSIQIDAMVSEVKKIVFFDGEIQDRLVTHWNSTMYELFRKATDWDKTATRKGLEFMIEDQKDLPRHTLTPAHLYNRLCSTFRSVTWCEILFQCTEAHEGAHCFDQNLISAAPNQDLRSKSQPKQLVLYHAT